MDNRLWWLQLYEFHQQQREEAVFAIDTKVSANTV